MCTSLCYQPPQSILSVSSVAFRTPCCWTSQWTFNTSSLNPLNINYSGWITELDWSGACHLLPNNNWDQSEVPIERTRKCLLLSNASVERKVDRGANKCRSGGRTTGSSPWSYKQPGMSNSQAVGNDACLGTGWCIPGRCCRPNIIYLVCVTCCHVKTRARRGALHQETQPYFTVQLLERRWKLC